MIKKWKGSRKAIDNLGEHQKTGNILRGGSFKYVNDFIKNLLTYNFIKMCCVGALIFYSFSIRYKQWSQININFIFTSYSFLYNIQVQFTHT